MPWKIDGKGKVRREFIELCWSGEVNMREACRRFGISRQCGYEWMRRAREEGWDQLEDRSHQTKRAEALQCRWRTRVLALRQKYPFSGADQLRWHLEQRYRLGPWPAVRTIGRWVGLAGMTKRRRRRAARGPAVELEVRRATEPNDVWTIDFKGWFYTRDGRRVCALTVRDLASRYVLLVRHMARTTERAVRMMLGQVFRRYGAPRAIRTDNGPPFGGEGPYGWSTLAVWWISLGIEVQYGRPGCPEDNAEHEQMHRVLHEQTAQPPAVTLCAQQRRFDRWRHMYNCRRPHRALGMQPPVSAYRASDRLAEHRPWIYSADCAVQRADSRGRVFWQKRQRLVGQAFRGQMLALKPIAPNVAAVYFGPHLLGELHAGDTTAIRAVCLRRSRPRRGG